MVIVTRVKTRMKVHNEAHWFLFICSNHIAYDMFALSARWPMQEYKHKRELKKHKMKPGLFTFNHEFFFCPWTPLVPISNCFNHQVLLFSITIVLSIIITTIMIITYSCVCLHQNISIVNKGISYETFLKFSIVQIITLAIVFMIIIVFITCQIVYWHFT